MDKKIKTLLLLLLVLLPIKVFAFGDGQLRILCKEYGLNLEQETECHIVTKVDSTNTVLLAHVEIATDAGALDEGTYGLNFKRNKIGTIFNNTQAFRTAKGAEFNDTIKNALNATPGLANSTPTNCANSSNVTSEGCYEFLYPKASFPNGIPTTPKVTTNPGTTNQDFANTVSLGYVTVSLDEDTLNDSDCASLCVNASVYEIGPSGKYEKTSIAGNCVELEYEEPKVCEIETDGVNTTYYGPSGTVVTEAEYVRDCEHITCGSYNGKWYDKNGNQVANEAAMIRSCYTPCGCQSATSNVCYGPNYEKLTRTQMQKACFSCEYKGGKYYDKDGQETTQATYKEQCTCVNRDGKYYDDTGAEVTKEEYDRICRPECACYPANSNTCFGPNHESLTKAQMQKKCFSCEYKGGKYYDKDGQETTQATYKEQCTCGIRDGKYYDKDGHETTQATYKQQCTCGIRDGKYYNQNGQVTSEENYYLQCNEHCECKNGQCYSDKGKPITEEEFKKICNPKCQYVGGKYYNKIGEEVTEQEFVKDCDLTCTCANNKCYNKEGKVVTREEYLKICEPKCVHQDGHYYNKKGEEVTKEEYQKDCNPKCECKNGLCYDNSGTPVTDEEYFKICNPKCLCNKNQCYNNDGKEITKEEFNQMCSCRVENDRYYGFDGKEITKEKYKQLCGCRKGNGKFYDFEGKEVTEEEWKAICVPNTGKFISVVTVGALALAIYGFYYIIKIYQKRKKIYKV